VAFVAPPQVLAAQTPASLAVVFASVLHLTVLGSLSATMLGRDQPPFELVTSLLWMACSAVIVLCLPHRGSWLLVPAGWFCGERPQTGAGQGCRPCPKQWLCSFEAAGHSCFELFQAVNVGCFHALRPFYALQVWPGVRAYQS